MSLPVIHHEPGRLPENIDQTLAAIVESNNGLFFWSENLYILNQIGEPKNGPVSRPAGSIVLVQANPHLIAKLATKSAVSKKFDGRANDYKVINCPQPVAQGICAQGYWPGVPPLTGIIEAPTITKSGREISTPGYDQETGIYAAFDKPLPPMRGKEGRAKALHGLSIIKDLLRGFPFVSESDRSAAIAGILTALLRKILPTAPLLAITATAPGTGKSMLADVISIIATGHTPSVLSMGSDENEFEKRITGALLAGESVLNIDNITRDYGKEAFFNQMFSSEYMSVRPLGITKNIRVKTNITVITTANGVKPLGDLKRRCNLIRMDAKEARPEHRQFTWSVIAESKTKRHDLIRGALEIIKFYLAAGKPEIPNIKPLGGFSDWDAMVRRPLIYLGEADPLEASDELQDHDPELEAAVAMLSILYEIVQLPAYQDKDGKCDGITAVSIVHRGTKNRDGSCTDSQLNDVLEVVCNGKINARRLGWWLRNNDGKIVQLPEGTDSTGKFTPAYTLKLFRSGYDGHVKATKWSVKRDPPEPIS